MKVAIKNPCSEDWNSFEKDGSNGFCLSCRKTVIDFTKYSDQEIIDYFKKHTSDKTCGRFGTGQLKTYTLPKKKSDFSAIVAVLTAGILSIAGPSESKASPAGYEAITTIDDEINAKIPVDVKTTRVGEDWIKISGSVKDKSGAIAGVNVVIKGTAKGTTTDEMGNFTIYHYTTEGEKITLVFSLIGYVDLEYEVARPGTEHDIGTVSLTPDVLTLGDVCIIDPWYSPRRWWWGIKNMFTRN